MNQNFNLGDKVIALSTGKKYAQVRTKGYTYEVTGILYCPSLGDQLININNNTPWSNLGLIKCGCGKRHKNNGKAWTYSTEFIKEEDIEEALNKAVKEEDYDLAIALRDYKKETS